MNDPILEEVWRVRQELIKQHGGVAGYFRHVEKIERAHRKRRRRPSAKKTRRQGAEPSR
jgi:hypothetical protein